MQTPRGWVPIFGGLGEAGMRIRQDKAELLGSDDLFKYSGPGRRISMHHGTPSGRSGSGL